jgi:hypothetical protein
LVDGALASYFATAVAGGPDDGAADLDWPLLSSFLRRRRDVINVLDIDECADTREAAARVRTLIAATLAGARVVAR